MQAIEFETQVKDGVLHLPAGAQLTDGQQVRVPLLYEGAEQAAASPSTVGDGDSAIARLLRNPLVAPGFEPLERDAVHTR